MKLISNLIIGLAAVILSSQAAAETFVIVHGAFQNSASWQQVAAALTSKGHTVRPVELPGRDTQGTSAKAISLAQYSDAVSSAIDQLKKPVILIGHSFGGITISMVALRSPEKIKKLVYVAAYVPTSGESMQSIAAGDKENGFSEKTFVVSPDYSFATILEEDRARLFINDGTPEQRKVVSESMLREPLGPIGTKVEMSPEKFALISKAYIRTTLDRTVSPTLQNSMIQRSNIQQVADIQAGHSPQTSQPNALADLIISISK
jgi:pimeloyl-ACP methyl ester carboxylesterase